MLPRFSGLVNTQLIRCSKGAGDVLGSCLSVRATFMISPGLRHVLSSTCMQSNLPVTLDTSLRQRARIVSITSHSYVRPGTQAAQ